MLYNYDKLVKDVKWLIEQVKCLTAFALSATTWSPAHTAATGNKYMPGTLVWYNGIVYKCRVENNGVPVANSFYWTKLGAGWLLDQEQGDWFSVGGPNFIRNKPTKLSQFINDVFLTAANQNNTWRQVFLGSYFVSDGKNALYALFEQELIVSDTENIMLIYNAYENEDDIVNNINPITYRYKFARGKGTWNPIPRIVGTDILFESASIVTSSDIITIINGGNTQTFPLGDITGDTLVDFINGSGPYEILDPLLTYYFLYEDSGITYLYSFIGTLDTYGDGATPITSGDLQFVASSEEGVYPVVPTETAQLLNNGANGVNPFITLADIPPFDPADYDLEEFNNVSGDPFIRESDLDVLGIDEVLGVGNIAYDNSMTIEDSATGEKSIIDPQKIRVETIGGYYTELTPSSIKFSASAGEGIIEASSLSSNVTFQLPDRLAGTDTLETKKKVIEIDTNNYTLQLTEEDSILNLVDTAETLILPLDSSVNFKIGTTIEFTSLVGKSIISPAVGVTIFTNLDLDSQVEETRLLTKISNDEWTLKGVNKEKAVIRKRVFVDSVLGDDATGEAEDSSKPFETVDAAIAVTDTSSVWEIELVNVATHAVNSVIPANSKINFISTVAATISWATNPTVGNLLGNTSCEIGFFMPIGIVSMTSVGSGAANSSFFGMQFGHLVIVCNTLNVADTFRFERLKSLNTNIRTCNLAGTLFYWLAGSDRTNTITIDIIAGGSSNIIIFDYHMEAGVATTFNNSSITSTGTVKLNEIPRANTVCTMNLKNVSASVIAQSNFTDYSTGTALGKIIHNFDNGVLTGQLRFLATNNYIQGILTVQANTSNYLFENLNTNYFNNGSLTYTSVGAIQNGRPGAQMNLTNFSFNLTDANSRFITVTGPVFNYTGFSKLLVANNYCSIRHITDNIKLFNFVSAGNPVGIQVEINGDLATNGLIASNYSTGLTITKTVYGFSENKKEITIKDKSQLLAAPLLSDVTYIIDGIIILTASEFIEIPAGGLTISGYSFDSSKITSTAASNTLFKSVVGGAGNLVMNHLTISTSGASSKVFNVTDIDGSHAIELNDVNFESCTSLGDLIGYRQFTGTTIGIYGCATGFTLGGTWNGFKLTNTNCFAFGSSGILFKEGTSLVFNNRMFLELNLSLPTGAIITDMDNANFSGDKLLQVRNCMIKYNSIVDDANTTILFPNIAYTDPKCYFNANVGLYNTGAAVIPATDTDAGIMKLYNALGANLDGSITQAFLTSILKSFDYKQVTRYFADFIPGSLLEGWTNRSSGAGSGATSGANPSNGTQFGVATLSKGTAVAGYGGLELSSINANSSFTLGYSKIIQEKSVCFPILSDATNEYWCTIGSINGNFANLSKVIAFAYDRNATAGSSYLGAASDNWKCITGNGGTKEITDTGIPIVAGQYYKLRLEVNSTATEIKFWIDNVLVATHTNTATWDNAFQFGDLSLIYGTVGSTNRTLLIDYCLNEQELNTPRI